MFLKKKNKFQIECIMTYYALMNASVRKVLKYMLIHAKSYVLDKRRGDVTFRCIFNCILDRLQMLLQKVDEAYDELYREAQDIMKFPMRYEIPCVQSLRDGLRYSSYLEYYSLLIDWVQRCQKYLDLNDVVFDKIQRESPELYDKVQLRKLDDISDMSKKVILGHVLDLLPLRRRRAWLTSIIRDTIDIDIFYVPCVNHCQYFVQKHSLAWS